MVDVLTQCVLNMSSEQIKIWEDRKAQPLVVLRPHDSQPVNSVTFVTAPHRPDHIILLTAVLSQHSVFCFDNFIQYGYLSLFS